jgi:hypothetical protein
MQHRRVAAAAGQVAGGAWQHGEGCMGGGGAGLCAEGEQARVGEAQEGHQACGQQPLGGPGCGWEQAVSYAVG